MNSTSHRFFRFVCVLGAAALIGACATPGAVPATIQPALAKLAEPYADGLRKAGVTSVMVYGNGARVRVASTLGEVYFRYPSGIAATEFALYMGNKDIEVDSDTFNAANSAQYEAAMKVILPEAIKWTTSNNTQKLQERNSGGGGGGR